MYNSKVIFLDMDGVINGGKLDKIICFPMTNVRGEEVYATIWGIDNLKPFLSLMKWCYNEGINIVISSTWRIGMTPELFNNYFTKYFDRNDLPIVSGLTNVCPYPYMHRGIEIKEYLDTHKEITQYLCIDDNVEDILEKISQENVYKTDVGRGLTKKDVANIKKQWYNMYNK